MEAVSVNSAFWAQCASLQEINKYMNIAKEKLKVKQQ